MTALFVNAALIMALLIPSGSTGSRFASRENKNVRCEIVLQPATVKAGASGIIALRLTPVKGVHINTNPEIEFSLDSLSGVAWKGIVDLPKEAKTGFLRTSKPVTFGYEVGAHLPPGAYKVSGSVKYFYCSDAEGWCNRFAQPFVLTLTVIR